MKKLLILGVLALASTATAAATWEYASFVVWNAKGEKTYFWNTPDETGIAKRTQGSKLTDISTDSGCNVKPQGQKVLNERDVFQCFGAKGWELVGTDVENLSSMSVKTYWFKRAK